LNTAIETIERLSRLHKLSLETFGNEQGASKFLLSGHPQPDGQSPFEAALTEAGGKSVEEIIRRGLCGLLF